MMFGCLKGREATRTGAGWRGSRGGMALWARATRLGATGLLAALVALAYVAAPALAAPARPAGSPTRPAENVAYARIAVVRVLTSYYGTTQNAGLVPALAQCAGTGALVGTTGQNLNSFNYVLLPTALVNPIEPCQGVKTTFAQFNGAAVNWGLIKIQVLLNVAYTGTGAQQAGSLAFTIDPSQIRTTGTASGPKLLALPLTIPSGAPAHDLPVLQTPQASDAPPPPSQNTFIDLTGQSGAPLNRDSLLKADVNGTLYPIAEPANAVFAPAAAPAASPAGTANATTKAGATPTAQPTTPPQPTALAAELSPGTVEVDGNGRLIGMIGVDAQGNHVLYGMGTVNAAIGGVTGKSGPLMTQWQQGLSAFYANPPQYTTAHAAFASALSAYPDFAGAQPFASAAAARTANIPSLTGAPGSPGGATQPAKANAGLLSDPKLLLAGGAAAVAVLGLLVGLVVGQRRRRGKTSPALAPADETMLDLLPPDMPLDQVPETPVYAPETPTAPMAGEVAPPRAREPETPTRPIPRVLAESALASAGGAGVQRAIDEIATTRMPAAPRPTAAPRKTSVLSSQCAGLTDPGVKRAMEPNQDNVFAMEGVRNEGGRMQPFGLFIVADGMGGHLNGQLASRLAIETVARSVAHALSPTQRLTPEALTQLLVEGVRLAQAELQRKNRETNGDMGTTVTAALVADDRAYVVNVGDSRTYVLSPDAGLRQITVDHSVVASLAAAGVIKPEDIYIHPRRNQIYRSLGGDDAELEVDAFEVDLQAGDKLLLCSDGLWEMVRDPQIANILRGAASPQQAVELLAREANANGGEDNIGVVVARMVEGMPSNAKPYLRMVAGPADEPPAGA